MTYNTFSEAEAKKDPPKNIAIITVLQYKNKNKKNLRSLKWLKWSPELLKFIYLFIYF